jgi:hypothetical protein
MRVQNVSGKGILSYSFEMKDSSGKSSYIASSPFQTGDVLSPGEIQSHAIILSPTTNVHLSACLFEDGTGEGEAKWLAYQRDFRAGVLAQYKRAAQAIEQVGREHQNDAVTQLERLQAIFESLPEESELAGDSIDKTLGVIGAKQYLVRSLKEEAARYANGIAPVSQVEFCQKRLAELSRQITLALRRDIAFANADARRRPFSDAKPLYRT